MKKLRLDLESIQVESFEASSSRRGIGTVPGFMINLDPNNGMDAAYESENPQGSCWASCPTAGCGTCYLTCWATCDEEEPVSLR
jgi:hypothetical protein